MRSVAVAILASLLSGVAFADTLRYSTRYRVSIDPAAASAREQALGSVFSFEFTTPTVRLLQAWCGRRCARSRAGQRPPPVRASRQSGSRREIFLPAAGIGTIAGGRWWIGRRSTLLGRRRAACSRFPPRLADPTGRSGAWPGRRRRGRGQRWGSSTPAGWHVPARPTLPAPFQTLPLRAIGDASARTLTWTVDGRAVGSSALDAAIDWPLAIGAHTIAVSDERGRADETSIVVK